MPKPTEICVVTAYGVKYDNWKTVEVSINYADLDTGRNGGMLLHAVLTVAELNDNSAPGANLSNLKLKPGDPVTVTLAGRLAMTGFVYLRQAAVDADQHGVQIGIVSASQNIVAATVLCQPGQYINQTLQQILSSAFGKVGVHFSIEGSPAGVDLPFKRVSEHAGESVHEFAKRLAYMRNIHLMDSQNGMVGFRGPSGKNGLQVTEGKNMLRGRVLLQSWDQFDQLVVLGQDHNNDS